MKLITLIALVFTSISWSQDYGKEIQRILTDFSEMESYHIEAEVFVSGDVDFSFKASVKTAKFGSRTVTDNTEMIVNKDYVVAIDHEEKTIRVDKDNYKMKSKGKTDLGLEMIDEQINEQGGVEYLGQTADYRTYVIHHNSSVTKTVVKINNATGFFQEIEVFYDSDEVSIASYRVKYTLFNRDTKFKQTDFDEKRFFVKNSDGSLSPTPTYRGYQVIKQY